MGVIKGISIERSDENMPIETLDDIIESIADKLGVYGCGQDTDHPSDCDCRICFVVDIELRILTAVEIEQRLGAMRR